MEKKGEHQVISLEKLGTVARVAMDRCQVGTNAVSSKLAGSGGGRERGGVRIPSEVFQEDAVACLELTL